MVIFVNGFCIFWIKKLIRFRISRLRLTCTRNSLILRPNGTSYLIFYNICVRIINKTHDKHRGQHPWENILGKFIEENISLNNVHHTKSVIHNETQIHLSRQRRRHFTVHVKIWYYVRISLYCTPKMVYVNILIQMPV